MRTVFCRVLKAPKPGDELRLCYTSARGGRTEVAYTVKPADVWEATDVEVLAKIAGKFAYEINTQWSSDLFSCKARGDEIVITCSQDDTRFYPMLNGTEEAGHEFMEIDN